MKKRILPLAIILLAIFLGFRIISTQIERNQTKNPPLITSNHLQLAEFKIEGMTCLPCMKGAQFSLIATKGVIDVEMNIDGSKTSGQIIYDLEKIKIDDIIEKIKPYQLEVISDNSTNITNLNK